MQCKMESSNNIIIKYLEGICSPEERIEFERRKREDADFAEEVKWYEFAYEAIELGTRERRRNELKEIASKDKHKPQAKRIDMTNRRTYWYAVAATLALLFMVYVFIRPRTPSISSQNLWAMNTDPLEINIAERSETIDDSANLTFLLDSLITKATNLHQSGACEEAQIIWEELAEKLIIDEYRLSTAICYLNAEKSSQALVVLQQLEKIQIQKGENAESIDDLISWYKIIAYMQQYEKGEEVKEALKKELLRYQEEGYFQHEEKVKEILEWLEG